MKQPTLQKWVRIEDDREEVERERTTRRRVVSLFDRHGIAVLPWADMGFECTAYDCATAHGNGPAEADLTASAAGHGTVRTERVRLKDADDVRGCLGRIDDLAFVIAIPPCRDLCAAGARWWRKKRGRNPEFQKVAEDKLPMGRLGEKAEIANLVTYLTSEHNNWMTGQVINFDGGEVVGNSGEFNILQQLTEEQWKMIIPNKSS